MDSRSRTQVVRKQSKTDPFRRGIDLFMGRTGNDLCPVAALLAYLADRGAKKGPLFMFEDGRFLTRQRLVNCVRAALHSELADSQYCGHSFRIGAATAAAAAGNRGFDHKDVGPMEILHQDSSGTAGRLLSHSGSVTVNVDHVPLVTQILKALSSGKKMVVK